MKRYMEGGLRKVYRIKMPVAPFRHWILRRRKYQRSTYFDCVAR